MRSEIGNKQEFPSRRRPKRLRIKNLEDELVSRREKCRAEVTEFSRCANSLHYILILSSFAAVVSAALPRVEPWFVVLIAALPGSIAIALGTFECGEKSQWWEKWGKLDEAISELRY